MYSYRVNKARQSPAIPESLSFIRSHRALPPFFPRDLAMHGPQLGLFRGIRAHQTRHGPAMPGYNNFLSFLKKIEEFGELSFRLVDAHRHIHSLVLFFSPIKSGSG